MNAQIERFVNQAGLLNVPLFHDQDRACEKYALLNGSTNNLCVDAEPWQQETNYKGIAWSAGNNNYLLFENGKCTLFRSDHPSAEIYPIQLILDHSDEFFAYLAKGKQDIENQIVPFVLRTFRELRHEIRTVNGGLDSLRALLYLLAYHYDDGRVELDNWGLDQHDKDIADSIARNMWGMIYEKFSDGIFLHGQRLKPQIDLILRHTAGKLFEEANYIACLPEQMSLFPDERIRYSYKTSQDGAFFTPAYVARSIVEETLRLIDLESKQSLTIFDPACGASGFLVEALRQLKKAGFDRPVKVIAWDKAETAYKMSKFLLNFEKKEWGDLLDIEDIRLGDSLSEDCEWPRNVDILLMNPPFLAWDKIEDRELQNRILKTMPVTGKPNLSSAFLVKAMECLAQDGVMGAVLPTTLLNDQTYEGIRSVMLQNMSLRVIGGLGSYVFETVMTYASMIIASKVPAPRDVTTVLWTNNVKGATEKGLKALRKYRYSNFKTTDKNVSVYQRVFESTLSSWRIENERDVELKNRLNYFVECGYFCKVQDIFDVRLGARTGNNKVFVVNEDVYEDLPNGEKKYLRPVVDNLTLDWGHLYKLRYVFYPYSKEFQINNEAQLREMMPTIYERILEPYKKELRDRATVEDKSKWWILSKHRSWQVEKKMKLVSTEFGGSGSFAIDYTGEYVVERGNMWMFNRPGFRPALKYYEAYLALFNSYYWNKVLSIFGSQLAGGNVYRLGMAYVKNIPLPDLTNELFSEFIPKLRSFAKAMKENEYWEEEELNILVKEILNHGE